VAARISLGSVSVGIVIGLSFDSFLGAVLAHWMQNAFAASSLFASAALLAVSVLVACLLPARHAIALPPARRRSSPLRIKRVSRDHFPTLEIRLKKSLRPKAL
jgi:predicted lysophospholipase L1 biosynthesis ABC-type transport system permease subunit